MSISLEKTEKKVKCNEKKRQKKLNMFEVGELKKEMWFDILYESII